MQVEAEISPAMPSRDSDGIVAAFRRHFSVVEILIIESDLAKRHGCIKDRHFIEIYLKSEVNDTDGIFQEIRASLNCRIRVPDYSQIALANWFSSSLNTSYGVRTRIEDHVLACRFVFAATQNAQETNRTRTGSSQRSCQRVAFFESAVNRSDDVVSSAASRLAVGFFVFPLVATVPSPDVQVRE